MELMIEAVGDGNATRASMHGNPVHQRRQGLSETVADASATRTSVEHASLTVGPESAADGTLAAERHLHISTNETLLCAAPEPIYVEETREERQAKRASRRAMMATRDASEVSGDAVAPEPIYVEETREERQAKRATRREIRKNPMSRVKSKRPDADAAFPDTMNPMARRRATRALGEAAPDAGAPDTGASRISVSLANPMHQPQALDEATASDDTDDSY